MTVIKRIPLEDTTLECTESNWSVCQVTSCYKATFMSSIMLDSTCDVDSDLLVVWTWDASLSHVLECVVFINLCKFDEFRLSP